MSEVNVWGEIVEILKKSMSDYVIDRWITSINIVELRGDVITISAPNRYYKTWIEDNYIPNIREAFAELLSTEASIEIIVRKSDNDEPSQDKPKGASRSQERTISSTTSLNRSYSFDNYVYGISNEFAYNACLAISEGYFRTYNPLFIYGGVGLGKTHLMHAVGNAIVERFPKMVISYINSENFVNGLLSALRNKTVDEFRCKYRDVDVLLFDDVQFLGGKEKCEEFFFHTFNSLYDSQKQIILTSDKPPNELPGIQDRLKSRFRWGLEAEIGVPSVEEKTAIIMKRAEFENMQIDENVALFMAENIKSSSIRELIGALIRLKAYSSFEGKPINVEFANAKLENFLIKTKRIVTSDIILSEVCKYFNVRIADLKSSSRKKKVSYPRQIAMYILKNNLDLPLSSIGDIFDRDHATVVYSVKNIRNKISKDDEIKEMINVIEKQIYS